jgi:hypothetical protein
LHHPVTNGQLGSLPVFSAQAEPTSPSPEAEAFYEEALRRLTESGIPFLVAGSHAVSAYTGIRRPTKDLDFFVTAGDYPRVLSHFKLLGYDIAIEDERWIGKVLQDEHFFDVIFASGNGAVPVTQQWFAHAQETTLFGLPVRMLSPTELIWSKAFIQLRHRYDGADVAHVILKQHDRIDWHRLLHHMEMHWELLLTHILNFRWIYPSERDHVPGWLMDELLDRLKHQRALPPPQMQVCRGRLLSRIDYRQDVAEWGFADVGGEPAQS